MKLLILDDEPRWLAHWAMQGVSTTTTLLDALADINAGNADTVVINARHLDMIPVLIKAGAIVIIASNRQSTAEAIAAYRAGGSDYVAKDFRMTGETIGAAKL